MTHPPHIAANRISTITQIGMNMALPPHRHNDGHSFAQVAVHTEHDRV